jgi:hypothetical protein
MRKNVANAALTQVDSSATTGVLLAAKPHGSRNGVIIRNSDANNLYIAYAATATTSAYTDVIEPGVTWEMPEPIYDGIISGIWAADGSGAAVITEL